MHVPNRIEHPSYSLLSLVSGTDILHTIYLHSDKNSDSSIGPAVNAIELPFGGGLATSEFDGIHFYWDDSICKGSCIYQFLKKDIWQSQ